MVSVNLTTRANLGRALNFSEMDANLTAIQQAIQQLSDDAEQFGFCVTPEQFGAVGDGVNYTADALAFQQAAALPGALIQGDPSKVYYVNQGWTCAAGVRFKNCRFKIKLGGGGFSSVETLNTRYSTTQVLLLWNQVDGGGVEDCEFIGDGGGDYICMPIAVQGGMSTRPFVTKGLNIIANLPGVTGCFVVNSIGAAGVRGAGSIFYYLNIGTTKAAGAANAYGPQGYWTRGGTYPAGDFTQVTCFSADGDLIGGVYSSRCDFGTHLFNNIFLEGQGYAKHGGQTDVMTLAGTGGNTSGCTIDRLAGVGPIDEPIDCQWQNVEIGSIHVKNSRFVVAKALYGCANLRIGRVHGEGVGRTLMAIFGNSANSTNTDNVVVDKVTGYGVGDYILDSGTLQAGSTTTATLRASGGPYHGIDNYYSAGPYGGVICITGGTGAGQQRKFTAYNGTTKVISGLSSNFSPAPDSTSTYRIIPYDERAAVVVEGDSTGAVTNCTVSGIAVKDTGFMDYITRSNQNTAGRNNKLEIGRDLGFQQRPALVAASGPTRTYPGPLAQAYCQMTLASDQTIASTSLTQVLFANKRIDTYDTPSAQGVQGSPSENGIRVRMPGLKTFSIKCGYLSWTAGESVTVSLYRGGSLLQSKTFSFQTTGAVNADLTVQFQMQEGFFDGGIGNLFQVYVQHSAATSHTLSSSTATCTTEFTVEG